MKWSMVSLTCAFSGGKASRALAMTRFMYGSNDEARMLPLLMNVENVGSLAQCMGTSSKLMRMRRGLIDIAISSSFVRLASRLGEPCIHHAANSASASISILYSMSGGLGARRTLVIFFEIRSSGHFQPESVLRPQPFGLSLHDHAPQPRSTEKRLAQMRSS